MDYCFKRAGAVMSDIVMGPDRIIFLVPPTPNMGTAPSLPLDDRKDKRRNCSRSP
ncbi:hypothetical protein A1F94_002446 [Pyrenophora tritici-repentis]|uniref:Uncharacterized protein n=1 Tax=Pyrenophora tritici-repentis TaxID=45151 RepID=A0A2W1EGE2_9PLEO|nr:hypothetical protein PtrV1_03657 [Pyrenophora tritici-repentis]KAF7451332.1 hypothetical protein A1F99_031090 [Pyrenophora tritici-repentis]KAF7575561.1 hypothetical protein PtrM4_071850 [Pyrenophora tritici-repentis]KAG9385696.1 hypothetical protein A1F94_002446 [Pyrenophora tritici-repentis]KAI0575018.1 hypothetical protein Alg215_08251 [Pyrenophora tritici-repentis]